MAITSAQELAQRALDYNLIDQWQLQEVWGELGSSGIALEELRRVLLSRDLLTYFQIEHLLAEDRATFFYGGYKILYLVGTGTFARVYRATSTETKDQAAIKALRKRFCESKEESERFFREGQMGMSLRHPNIVPIYDVGTEGDTPYLVIEFVEGRNLRDFVKIRKIIDPQEATRLVLGICNGLQYASERGIFHRDMKLSNVLVTTRGEARLVDFGLAGANKENVSDDMLVKNPNPRAIDYAGLERATGVKKNDPRSDIYFVGGIYYHLLCGQAPWSETKDRAQRLSRTRYSDIPSIGQFNPSLPAEYAAIANRALQFDPGRRYQTPSEMAADLHRLLEEIPCTGKGAAAGAETAGAKTAGPETPSRDEGPKEGWDEEGNPRTLMIVESDVRMQDLLRNRFKRNGYRVLVMSDTVRALNRLTESKGAADLVLFCTGDLEENAIAAFNDLLEHSRTAGLPAVLLLDEKHRDLRSQARTADHRLVVTMPLKWRQLREALASVLAAGT